MTEELRGVVAAIVFHSADGVFCVFRMKLKDSGKLITAAGEAGTPSVGQSVTVRGCWVRHPRFGMQFKAEAFVESRPENAEEIRDYLASGSVEGIGPQLAQRITDRFGSRTLEIMDENMEALLDVPGIGPKKLEQIRKSYEEGTALRTLTLTLQAASVPVRFAASFLKTYGEEAEHILKNEPYRAVSEIPGFSFQMADRIALAEGLSPGSEERILGGLFYVLSQYASEGHCCVPADALYFQTAQTLGLAQELVESAGQEAEEIGEIPSVIWRDRLFLYLPSLYEAETESAQRLREMSGAGYIGSAALSIRKFEKENGIALAEEQKQAVRSAMESGLLIITGGPGTGKTTIIQAIITAAEQHHLKVRLMAPTGRAAKRLSIAAGRNADTIHKALEAERRGEKTFFGKNESEPLREDLIIVDESSMMDMLLFYRLLCALKPGARLILVGDIDQLPPVGPGAPLKALIEWGEAPVVRLQRIFRQKEGSGIIQNAARIREGLMPEPDLSGDFQICFADSEEEAYSLVMTLCREYGYETDEQKWNMQVLSPMYRGLCGVDHLNQAIQQYVHGGEVSGFMKGDKVMQMRNDYEKGVYNGDIGLVWAVNGNRVFVHFAEKEVVYEGDERRDIQLAYAVTVHKSQGSEYDMVILVLLPSQRMMLQRNLLYTGMTRAGKRTILITMGGALQTAVRRHKTAGRCSMLLPLLAGEARE